jgi:hypothetical protein
VAGLPAAAYGGWKNTSEAWAGGVLAVVAEPAAVSGEEDAVPEALREAWEEWAAIMVADGKLPRADAERLAWAGLQSPAETR